MAQWKRRRPPTPEPQAAEGLEVVAEGLEDTEGLTQGLAWREEEIRFLRAQLAQAIAGWREAQQQIFALEALEDEADEAPAAGVSLFTDVTQKRRASDE